MSRVRFRSARQSARGAAVCAPVRAGFRPAAAALAVAAVFGLPPGTVAAQPTGPQVIHGQASFAPSGNNLVITTQNGPGSKHSAINWQSFSVPAGSVTRFVQPTADSTSINRVLGPDPSSIFGTLASNGRLVLVNPAGIAVGAGAVVDTAGFTASTLQMSEADAIAGLLRFRNEGRSGALTVQGTVRAQGGDIVLVAPNVQTASEALIQSDGATVLAAGQKVEISGRGLEGIHLDVQAGDQAVNLGRLQGDAVGIFAGTLRHSGLVQAQAVSVVGGKVVLQATGGDALVSGAVQARGHDGQGGAIDVLGGRVGLLAGATLDASGASGGGQVRVGGDYQGRNAAVPNAAFTYVDAGATIRADATQQGDGGRVIVWSDEGARMHGQLSARGGPQGGNGGFAEVSGKQALEFTGSVDLRAPLGKAGTLSLDTAAVQVMRDEDTYALNTEAESNDLDTLFGPVIASEPSRLSDLQLNNALAGGNVQVTTTAVDNNGLDGRITFNRDAFVSWSTASQLTLSADKGMAVHGQIIGNHPDSVVRLAARTGDISFAGGTVADEYRLPVFLLAGGVDIQAAKGNVSFSPEANVISFGGSLNVVAGGSITGSGNFLSFRAGPGPGTGTSTDSSLGAADGDIHLSAGDAIVLDARPVIDTVSRLSVATGNPNSGGINGGVVTLKAPSITITSPTQVTGSASVQVLTDNLALEGTLQAPAGATVLAPLSGNRSIRLGGLDDGTALHLSQDELARITASTLTIGDSTLSGGIRIAGPITLPQTQVLSLLNAGAIAQDAGSPLSVGSLDAVGGSVLLDQVNIAHALSGRSLVGGFQVDNRSANTLEIGTTGITGSSSASPVRITTQGGLRIAAPVGSAATGDAVVLSAPTLTYAAAGNAIATPKGRWLVYLPTPDGSLFTNALGKLDSGNQAVWNRAFDGQPIAQSGNRYVFAVQPMLDKITVLSSSKVYDGSVLAPTVAVDGSLVDAGLYGNVFLQDTIGGKLLVVGQSKNVGSYAVEPGSFGVAGYGVRSFTGGTVTITPRALHVALAAQDKVYDGNTLAGLSLLDDRIGQDQLAFTSVARFADKNVGTGKLVTASVTALSGADARNYTLAPTTTSLRASITPRPLNLTLAAQDKVYDGTTSATFASSDDRVAGDQLTTVLAGRFADRNVGAGKAVTVDALLAGADAGNYVLRLPARAQVAAITPRTLHVAATAQDKVYDGTVGAAFSLGDDRVAGDALGLAGTARFADANAGNGKRVDVQLAALSGGDAGNYVLAQPTVATRAAITPAALTITARDATKLQGEALRFDGSEFSASGLVAGETVPAVALASAGADAAAKADRYAITPSAAVAGGSFLPSNYDISYREGLLTVLAPASPTTLQVNNQVVTFARLFVQEALRQQDERKGRDDITVTDTACKP